MSAFEAIAELVAERNDIDVADVTADSTFESLGIDSLDTVEMLMDLEEKLEMDEIILEEKVATVGELAAYIEKLKGNTAC